MSAFLLWPRTVVEIANHAKTFGNSAYYPLIGAVALPALTTGFPGFDAGAAPLLQWYMLGALGSLVGIGVAGEDAIDEIAKLLDKYDPRKPPSY